MWLLVGATTGIFSAISEGAMLAVSVYLATKGIKKRQNKKEKISCYDLFGKIFEGARAYR